MKTPSLILSACLTGILTLSAQEKPEIAPVVEKDAAAPPKTVAPLTTPAPVRPRIEVCFVLDTTGSMSGLIEGAKQKIWSLANEIISAKPAPEVKFSLVGYRDRGDAYVVKTSALTDDIDRIYSELRAFKADGGGDTPESVSEALQAAVREAKWSDDKSVLKIIYLVGDAPPHTDYKDGPDYRTVCREAASKGVLINTIQCGNIAGTAEIWKEIAQKADGQYVALAQTGNMRIVETPFDKEMQELNQKIGTTLIGCGSVQVRQQVAAKQFASEAASASVASSRLSYNWKDGKSVQGGGELIDEIAAGRRKLEEVKKDELPEELRSLDADALKKHVETKAAERKALNEKLAELVKKRDAWLAEDAKKNQGAPDSFDVKVSSILREQAKAKGIQYETK